MQEAGSKGVTTPSIKIDNSSGNVERSALMPSGQEQIPRDFV
jgi:hypothetical protein